MPSNDVRIKIICVEGKINDKANFPLLVCMVCDFLVHYCTKKDFFITRNNNHNFRKISDEG